MCAPVARRLVCSDMTSEPHVFVVDDDPAIGKSICLMVESLGLQAEVYLTASEFLEAFDPRGPACLLLDVCLPDMDGVELLEHLRARNITVPAIMVSGDYDVPKVVRAMKAGAFDFLPKSALGDRRLLLDRIWQALFLDVAKPCERADEAGARSPLSALTPEEREVMELLAAGKVHEQIAEQLGISEGSVQDRCDTLVRKTKSKWLADRVRCGGAARSESEPSPAE